MGETRELHHIIGSVNHYAYGTIEAEEFSVSQRRRILAVISLVSFVGPLANFLFLPSLPEITEDLNAKSYQVTLSSAVFQLPLALFPLLWGPLSERLGRRKLYLFVTMYLIIIFYATALSPGIWSLILFRFLTGIPLAALFVLGYGVIGDIYPPESRAKAAV
jgi:MFS family permease